MHVRELMTNTPRVCQLSDTANKAACIMWEHDCGVVPVVDWDGRIAGIVTDRDICMAAYLQGVPLTAIPVANIMSRELCTVEAEAELSDAERLMQERQVRRLPVVSNGGRLVGILSLSDVAQGVNRNPGLRQAAGESQQLLRTVGKVSEPRVLQSAH
jgi:CBS domain-containing protein